MDEYYYRKDVQEFFNLLREILERNRGREEEPEEEEDEWAEEAVEYE